jgi:hypothetical protein
MSKKETNLNLKKYIVVSSSPPKLSRKISFGKVISLEDVELAHDSLADALHSYKKMSKKV